MLAALSLAPVSYVALARELSILIWRAAGSAAARRVAPGAAQTGATGIVLWIVALAVG